MKDIIEIEVTQDFLDWWQSTIFIKDEGLMYVAWAAWKACRTKYNQTLEPTREDRAV